jgi:hydroxymethylbilane synthase
MRPLRIATRASELAIFQAKLVARCIGEELGYATELVPMKTTGDRLKDAPLAMLGGKGLFVKELEEALLCERADLAVHSAKDLPAVTPPELEFVAFPVRADPRDALVARERGATLVTLPPGARVGTGSVRRAAQLRALRGDLEIVPLRGNVHTRLRKLEEDGLDAVILACAGLDRLGEGHRIDERIAPEYMLSAIGQGALAVQARRGDPRGRDLAALSHPETVATVAAERAFLGGLGGDCDVPIAALAEHTEIGSLRLRVLVATPDGSRLLRHESQAAAANAVDLGAAAADVILRRGGGAVLAEIRSGALS